MSNIWRTLRNTEHKFGRKPSSKYFYTQHKNFRRCKLHEYSSLQRIHGAWLMESFTCPSSFAYPVLVECIRFTNSIYEMQKGQRKLTSIRTTQEHAVFATLRSTHKHSSLQKVQNRQSWTRSRTQNCIVTITHTHDKNIATMTDYRRISTGI